METKSNNSYIKTRSQNKMNELQKIPKQTDGYYPVNIDFDEASKEWLLNKKKFKNGEYEYKYFM